MTILQIAHSDTVKFESPETEPYSRYTLKLHKLASPLISEHSDVLGFVNYRTSTVKTETGFKKSVVRGVGSGERVMYLSERPAYTAKQRYNLPDSIPLSWDALAEHIPYFNATNAKKEAAYMADARSGFRRTAVEPSAPRDTIPPGKYNAQIVRSEMKDTSTGGQMLVLEMESSTASMPTATSGIGSTW
jgi:hypothetical protein